jgi:6-phosphogluconate dehydrogenase
MALPVPAVDSADVGLIGLAVMGQNLALNMADHGFKVAVYNRTTTVTEATLEAHPVGTYGEKGGFLIGAAELKDFVASIKRPRRIIILVKAGPGTDAVIDSLTPLVEAGDLIIDGGNAEWSDTVRRGKALHEKGILYIGSGVSGGEEGARFGPSLMPGGSKDAWPLLEPIWTAIAAKVDPETGKPLPGASAGKPVEGGVPCTTWIGAGGAGHYVKMVHNGIEYGDMQLIAEAYAFMRDSLRMNNVEIADVFTSWNTGELDSFLIQITADILKQKDPVTGKDFVDMVLDAAGQKGTGKWTINSSLDLGIPATVIAEAVFARQMSSAIEQRRFAAKILKVSAKDRNRPNKQHMGAWIAFVRDALYCSKICSYAQGFALMAAASHEYGWDLKLGEIASIFRGGCIIRARFLQKITEAYARRPELANLVLDEYFAEELFKRQSHWRTVVAHAAMTGIPVPAFAASLSWFDSYRSRQLPHNLLQAQRDYFGAHTYERIDAPRGKFFHLQWLTEGRPQTEIQ